MIILFPDLKNSPLLQQPCLGWCALSPGLGPHPSEALPRRPGMRLMKILTKMTTMIEDFGPFGLSDSVYSHSIRFIYHCIKQTFVMDSHHLNETNLHLFVLESRNSANTLLMHTSLDSRQLKLGM